MDEAAFRRKSRLTLLLLVVALLFYRVVFSDGWLTDMDIILGRICMSSQDRINRKWYATCRFKLCTIWIELPEFSATVIYTSYIIPNCKNAHCEAVTGPTAPGCLENVTRLWDEIRRRILLLVFLSRNSVGTDDRMLVIWSGMGFVDDTSNVAIVFVKLLPLQS